MTASLRPLNILSFSFNNALSASYPPKRVKSANGYTVVSGPKDTNILACRFYKSKTSWFDLSKTPLLCNKQSSLATLPNLLKI